jgi:hypothetical protein
MLGIFMSSPLVKTTASDSIRNRLSRSLLTSILRKRSSVESVYTAQISPCAFFPPTGILPLVVV